MEDLQITSVSHSADYSLGYLENWVVLVWHCSPTIDGLRALETLLIGSDDVHALPLVCVTVIEPSAAQTISSDARDELERVLLSTASMRAVHVVVYEGEGIRAAIVRSVLSFMALKLRKAISPPAVVRTLDEGVSRAIVALGPHYSRSAEDLAAAVARFRLNDSSEGPFLIG